MVTDPASFSEESIADLCVEYWRLLRSASKALEFMASHGEHKVRRLDGQVRYSERQLHVITNDLGVRLVEFEGEPYRAGMAASADNAAEFGDDANLVVSRTVEPAVVKEMRVLRHGRVLVEIVSEEKGKD